jgi:ABC-type Mn2+/Zn2+ transport system permease subunit
MLGVYNDCIGTHSALSTIGADMDQNHSTIREGILTGLVGGVVAAIWQLIVDLSRGELFRTPSLLGQVLLGGDSTPTRTIIPQAVAGYALLHFLLFFLLGIAVVALTHMASRNPSLRMGVWLGLVIAFLFSIGFLLALYYATHQRFPWVSALGGSVLGVGSMGLFLWRGHPGLRGSFDEAPLGAEVKAPPHPRGTVGR